MRFALTGPCAAALLGLLLSAHPAAADTELVGAVKRSDVKAVRALLQRPVDVGAPDGTGTTALHWAAQLDNLETARLLLAAGARPATANSYGVTPLMLAATNGSVAMIDVLLDAGADAKGATPEGETVLMIAARTGVEGAVRTLISHGADLNAAERWRGQTALMWAAAEGHAGAVRALASRGADVHARSTGGLTALLFAVRAGELDAVRALVEARANPNDAAPDGTGALAVAVINAHYELAALLLESGADPNAPDPRGSALHALAWMRNPGYAAAPPRAQTGSMDSLTLAQALLDHGANPNARVQWKEIRFDRDGGVVKAPPNISIGRSYVSFVGATPFYIAARGADVALMRMLADYGADPRLPTVQNVTPLMAAAGLGFWDGESPGPESGVPESQALEAVKLAWELGNDVKARTDFGDMRIEGDPTVLLRRHPLNLGAFPDTALGDMRWGGSTALHGAAIRGANSIVSFLVEKGADPSAKNGLGWTPLTVAEGVFVANTEKNWPETVALLRRLSNQPAQP